MPAPSSLLTHIALPVRDLDATLAFYAKYTTLAKIHERHDETTGLRSVWLANQRDVTTEGAARFVIVLICGKFQPKSPATSKRNTDYCGRSRILAFR